MASISRDATLTVDIGEFTDSELLDEVEWRGLSYNNEPDLSEVEDAELIDALQRSGHMVLDKEFIQKDILEYLMKIMPKVNIGSEEFFFQENIRSLYRKWDI